MVDEANRENEGDIVFAASKATPELLAFTIRYGRGLICVPMLGPDLDRLHVPQMTSQNQEHHGTAFTISVDARDDITTGISAADRAKTIQAARQPHEHAPMTWCVPATCSRSGTPRAACSAGAAIPRPPSTWPCSPACRQSAWCAR